MLPGMKITIDVSFILICRQLSRKTCLLPTLVSNELLDCYSLPVVGRILIGLLKEKLISDVS